MNLLPKRESLTINGIIKDYLTIYDSKDNSILIQIEAETSNEELRIVYDGLEYVSLNNQGEILITLNSILNKFKKHETV